MPVNTSNCSFGWKATEFKLKSIDEKIYTLQDLKGLKGTVIVFICNHCPYVKAIADRLAFESRELTKIGISTIAIMSNDVENYPEDSFENMKNFSNLHNFKFPYLYDESQVVELSDSSGFLIPSKDITDQQIGTFSDKPFTTRYPSMFRLGISRNFNNDMIVGMDLSTGFSSTLGSYDEWRLSIGTEITRFKHFPIRFGIGLGGDRGASLSVGSGIWYGPVHFDIGLAYKKGLTVNSSKGLDIGISLSIH